MTLIGDMIYWVPSGLFLIGSATQGWFSVKIALIPVSTIGVFCCAFMMGRLPKLHVIWGTLVLLFSAIAIAFDGDLLIEFFPYTSIFIIALALILIGGVWFIIWEPLTSRTTGSERKIDGDKHGVPLRENATTSVARVIEFIVLAMSLVVGIVLVSARSGSSLPSLWIGGFMLAVSGFALVLWLSVLVRPHVANGS